MNRKDVFVLMGCLAAAVMIPWPSNQALAVMSRDTVMGGHATFVQPRTVMSRVRPVVEQKHSNIRTDSPRRESTTQSNHRFIFRGGDIWAEGHYGPDGKPERLVLYKDKRAKIEMVYYREEIRAVISYDDRRVCTQRWIRSDSAWLLESNAYLDAQLQSWTRRNPHMDGWIRTWFDESEPVLTKYYDDFGWLQRTTLYHDAIPYTKVATLCANVRDDVAECEKIDPFAYPDWPELLRPTP